MYHSHQGSDTGSHEQDPVNKNQLNKREAPARATATYSPFSVGADLRTWAAEHVPGVNVDREYDAFMDWTRANGKTFKDWPAAFRNWLRKAPTLNSNGHAPRVGSSPAPARPPNYIDPAVLRGERTQ